MAITFASNNQEETARKGLNSQNEVNKRYDICYKLLRRKKRFKNYDNFLTYCRQTLKEAYLQLF